MERFCVRVVKEGVSRTLGKRRVGSNPIETNFFAVMNTPYSTYAYGYKNSNQTPF